MYRPLALLSVMYIAGILTGSFLNGKKCPVIIIVLLFLLGIIILLLRKRKKEACLLAAVAVISLPMFFYGEIAGGRNIYLKTEEFIKVNNEPYMSFTAKVDSISASRNGFRIKAELINASAENEHIEPSGEYVLLYTDQSYLSGDVLAFKGTAHLYASAYNDGEFDAAAYYRTRGIACYVYPDEPEIIKKDNSIVYKIKNAAYKLRSRVLGNLKDCLGSSGYGIAAAVLTGEKAYIEDEVRKSLNDAGLSHILAVSGLHISIIGMGFFSLLRRLRASLPFSAVMTMALLCFFTIFSGFQVSCIRAVVMVSFYMLSHCIGRKYDAYTALSAAALIVLLRQPLYLYDASFLLSFYAGFSVKLTQDMIAAIRLYGSEKRNRAVKSLLFAVMIQLLMLPAQLHFFYGFSPYSIILNIVMLPLMSLFLPCALYLGLLGKGMALTGMVSFVTDAIAGLYSVAGRTVKGLPVGRIVCGRPDLIMIIISVLIIALGFAAVIKKKRSYALLIFLLLPLVSIVKKPDTGLYQLYVGQGDCAVLLSGRAAVLIDCGSSDREGLYEYVIEPFFNYHGYAAPDIILLSHKDEDHTSGAVEYLTMLKENGEPKGWHTSIFLPSLKSYEGFDELIDLADELDAAELKILPPESILKTGEESLLVLYPDMADISDNDSSMVLLLMGRKNVLYTGDISAEVEELLIDDIKKLKENLNIDILKVAHHGSRFSSSEAFLAALGADKAVISAGKNNIYSHPDDETLTRLYDAGYEVHVTSREGMIRLY